MSTARNYKKLQLRDQILLRPDTYIGATDVAEEKRWIYDAATGHMVHRLVAMNPGLYKIFDEILVNARDAWVRGAEEGRTPVKHIDVVVEHRSPDDCTIKVSNDGDGIPIEMHPEEHVYVGELIFGHLLTSSNYNDEEDVGRITGGKNGFGAKLTNIYSRRFALEAHGSGKSYTQTWRNNMSVCEAAAVKRGPAKGLVSVEFDPDFSRFPGGMSEDMLAVFQTRVIELAACVGAGVKVSWNGAVVSTNSFERFVKLFLREGISGMAYEECGPRWSVATVLASQLYTDDENSVIPDVRSISFVNGINTRKGGNHVDYVISHVLGDFCEVAKAAKGKKRLEIKPGQIKNSVVFFVNATIVNPAFDSQTKENMTSAVAKWGSKPTFSGALTEKLTKLGLLDEARDLLEARVAKEAKKTDGKKRSTLHGLPKLKDALWAGTPKSTECTLILTEGDSAMTSAISGLAVVGGERFGVFPLKGKLLNVKDISLAKFNANEEMTAIKRILGLEQGKVYKDTKSLRYGRVMVMADQDHDGSHIKGLLMNLFHTEWPSLLGLGAEPMRKTSEGSSESGGFICSLMTPILKASKGHSVLSFYSIPQYEAWRAEDPSRQRGWHVKYYKGLGTSTPAEAREWFENMNEVDYIWTGDSDAAIELAFSKKMADDRKTWLGSYDAKRMLDVAVRKVPFERFIHDELIHFSNADNIRSLPSLMDGLKPSQRKILYSCFKRRLTSEIRVAQLAGYVSEHAAYHHGEASLNGAIIGMAQNFVGSNNINLLRPIGQFGSRLLGGKDAASPRYIHTHLERIVEAIYKREDAAILSYTQDDGETVEPEYYLPILPMLLVNGCVGIGTGFSTDVPAYDPAQLVSLLRMRLDGSAETLAGRDLDPWFQGFRGSMTRSNKTTWITHGVYQFNDEDNSITITELPVGKWSQAFKEDLDGMFIVPTAADTPKRRPAKGAADGGSVVSSDKPISVAERIGLESFVDDYNDRDVRFVLKFTADGYMNFKLDVPAFEKAFDLTANHKTSNMVCFDAYGHISRYETVGDIMEEFYERRLEGYVDRKQAALEALESELEELRARRKFIQLVLDEEIVIAKKEDEEIVDQMLAHDLPPLSEPLEPGSIKAYEYLLRMRLDRLKASSVIELTKQVEAAEAAYAELEATTESQLWIRDLDEFDVAWSAMLAERVAETASGPSAKRKGVAVKRKGANAAK